MRNRFLIILFILFIGCQKFECKERKAEYEKNECFLILKKGFEPSFSNPYLKLEGIDPKTGEYCKCQDTGRMWGMFQSYMEKGDTFVKRKGEDFFTIHKKDTVFRIEWGDCDEDNEYIIPNNPPQDYNKVKRH